MAHIPTYDEVWGDQERSIQILRDLHREVRDTWDRLYGPIYGWVVDNVDNNPDGMVEGCNVYVNSGIAIDVRLGANGAMRDVMSLYRIVATTLKKYSRRKKVYDSYATFSFRPEDPTRCHVSLNIFLNTSQKCRIVTVGTREVPITKIVCDENVDAKELEDADFPAVSEL
jgi:hypothetical protein